MGALSAAQRLSAIAAAECVGDLFAVPGAAAGPLAARACQHPFWPAAADAAPDLPGARCAAPLWPGLDGRVLRLWHVQPVRIARPQLHAKHAALAWPGDQRAIDRPDPAAVGRYAVCRQGLCHPQGADHRLRIAGAVQPAADRQRVCQLGWRVSALRAGCRTRPWPVQPGRHLGGQQGGTGRQPGRPAGHLPGHRLCGHNLAHSGDWLAVRPGGPVTRAAGILRGVCAAGHGAGASHLAHASASPPGNRSSLICVAAR